jgi:acetoin utilization deacetylase AcuC-like enzyme
MKSAIYTSRSGLKHDTGEGHPESPDRLQTLLDLFEKEPSLARFPLIYGEAVDRDLILQAHDVDYVNRLEDNVPENGLIAVDGDTIMSPASLDAAYDAAGACVQAVDDLLDGKVERAFCAVRPPGHHAEPHMAMGFCFFNNIFLAAKHARERGVRKILILDFDVHHGNGTDVMVRREEDMYFISSHQMPLFPGTGRPSENIDGHILNIPLEAGMESDAFRDIYMKRVFPEIRNYQPELILVSAGFDAHMDDPLAQIELQDDDFKWLGEQISAICDELGCPSLSTLEGGYHLEALKKSVHQYLLGYMKE